MCIEILEKIIQEYVNVDNGNNAAFSESILLKKKEWDYTIYSIWTARMFVIGISRKVGASWKRKRKNC